MPISSRHYGLLGKIGQPASYCCLRSPDRSWQILAGDTGLHDRDPFGAAASLTQLDPAEELWHADKLRGFPGRTIFLTHHQPFSAFAQVGLLERHDPVNANLMASAGRLAAARRIDAWFWGHEHRLRLYAPYRGISAGRNIGYSAIPVQAAVGPETPLPGLIDPPPRGRSAAGRRGRCLYPRIRFAGLLRRPGGRILLGADSPRWPGILGNVRTNPNVIGKPRPVPRELPSAGRVFNATPGNRRCQVSLINLKTLGLGSSPAFLGGTFTDVSNAL